MLDAQVKQFKLSDDGRIYFQADPTNPLPGEAVARLVKGPAILEPAVALLDGVQVAAEQKEATLAFVSAWVKTYIGTVLEPLVALSAPTIAEGPVRDIASKVHEAMGITPRENLESLIAGLTPDTRRELRGLKVRLGPVLVFQPDLNKPAAVRLRALLWTLFNDKSLPAAVPNDGVVSLKIDPAAIDRNFYQAIGYPVYGPRAIRIDMLDRVISAIYDGAEGGKFKALHQMAEWLGCPIDDLYEILTAMGHRKEEAPAEVKPEEPKAEEVKTEDVKSEEAKAEAPAKPDLATFRLKKGKAFEQHVRKPRPEFKKPDRSKDSKDKDRKHKFKGKKPQDRKPQERRPMVIESGPKPKLEDSPFAILGQLKVKKDAG